MYIHSKVSVMTTAISGAHTCPNCPMYTHEFNHPMWMGVELYTCARSGNSGLVNALSGSPTDFTSRGWGTWPVKTGKWTIDYWPLHNIWHMSCAHKYRQNTRMCVCTVKHACTHARTASGLVKAGEGDGSREGKPTTKASVTEARPSIPPPCICVFVFCVFSSVF